MTSTPGLLLIAIARPRLISDETRVALRELMRFRPLKQYYLAFDYDWEKLLFLKKSSLQRGKPSFMKSNNLSICCSMDNGRDSTIPPCPALPMTLHNQVVVTRRVNERLYDRRTVRRKRRFQRLIEPCRFVRRNHRHAEDFRRRTRWFIPSDQ